MTNKKKLMGFALTTVLLTGAVSQGALMVYFSEDARRVSIDMVGTITIDSSYTSANSVTSGEGFALYNNALLIGAENSVSRIAYANSGVASASTLGLTTSFSSPEYGAVSGGFFGNDLYAVGEGTLNAIEGTRTYDFTGVSFSIGVAVTLANMGADSFDHQLAWTANGTGDTITYVTGAVPEPATAGLLAGAGLVIVICRRFRKHYGFRA